MNLAVWYRPSRNGKDPVLQVGRYRQEFWKPLVRAEQHVEHRPSKPLLNKGRKPR